MKINVDIEINSPKNKVWTAITDIKNCTNMISGIIDLEILHQPKEGIVDLKWTETRKIFGKVSSETMWITECQDEEYYCTRAENHGAIYTTKMSVSGVGSKTLLTMVFSGTSESIFVKLISSIMSFFLKKSMVKMLRKDLADIKNFVEKS